MQHRSSTSKGNMQRLRMSSVKRNKILCPVAMLQVMPAHLLQTKELMMCISGTLLNSWASVCDVIDCRLPMITAVCLLVLRHRSRWGSRSPSLQPETLLRDNKDTRISKYNYFYIISCIIISKTRCKSGHIQVQLNQHMVTDLQKSGLFTSRFSTDIP